MDYRVFGDVPIGGYFAIDASKIFRKISATKIRIFGENNETEFNHNMTGVQYYGQHLNSVLSHAKVV